MELIGKKDFHYYIILLFVYFFIPKSLFWLDAFNIFHYRSFLDDIEVMLKWRPPVVYKYLWKYVCLLAMTGLLAASLLRMVFKRPTYTAWNQSTVRYQTTAFCPIRIYIHITLLYCIVNMT